MQAEAPGPLIIHAARLALFPSPLVGEGGGRAREGAACAPLRWRARSPAGIPLAVFANRTFVPRAQLRARLPERRHKRSGHSRTRRLFGHSDAPRAPVVLPAGMMPEPPGSGVYLSAAGRRTRPAAGECPRPTAPFKGARLAAVIVVV